MKVAKYMGHVIVIVLCCILTVVLAETLDTRHLQKQHIKHLTQQQVQQQQTQQYHSPQQQQQQHTHHRQHLRKLRQQQLLSNSATAISNSRQSRKFDLKSPPISNKQQENPNSQVELIENLKNTIPKNATTAPVPKSTKLRRLSAKDYYNRAVQRRYNLRRSAHDEWAYNTYNVHTNTFGSTQTQSHSGKGDDNSGDVEFVSNTGVKSLPDWSRRGYAPTSAPTRKTTTTTQAPPAMVPARRGYPMVPFETPTTEDPFESNVISKNPGGGIDSKDMEK